MLKKKVKGDKVYIYAKDELSGVDFECPFYNFCWKTEKGEKNGRV